MKVRPRKARRELERRAVRLAEWQARWAKFSAECEARKGPLDRAYEAQDDARVEARIAELEAESLRPASKEGAQ